MGTVICDIKWKEVVITVVMQEEWFVLLPHPVGMHTVPGGTVQVTRYVPVFLQLCRTSTKCL
jgi:hypothetical protein